MADSKLSEFLPVTEILSSDIIPLIQAGSNRVTTTLFLSGNLPVLGVKGKIKKKILDASLTIQVSSSSVFRLGNAALYTLPAGEQDQEVTLLFTATSMVSLTGKGFSSISGNANSTITLQFDNGGWYVTGNYLTTVS